MEEEPEVRLKVCRAGMKHRAHRSLRAPELAFAQLLQFFGTTLEHLAASTLEGSLPSFCIPETSGACSRPNLSEVVCLCVHGSLSPGTLALASRLVQPKP